VAENAFAKSIDYLRASLRVLNKILSKKQQFVTKRDTTRYKSILNRKS